MSMDLVISHDGQVMLASNRDFGGEVTRVDFDAQKRLLMLGYRDAGQADAVLNMPVHDRMLTALTRAPAILLVHVEDNCVQGGWRVPLLTLS